MTASKQSPAFELGRTIGAIGERNRILKAIGALPTVYAGDELMDPEDPCLVRAEVIRVITEEEPW